MNRIRNVVRFVFTSCPDLFISISSLQLIPQSVQTLEQLSIKQLTAEVGTVEMSVNGDGEDKNNGFAKAWAAAKSSVGKAAPHGRGLRLVETVVKQESREVEKLLCGSSPDPTLAGTRKASEDTRKASEDTNAVPVLTLKGDNPVDKSYCPTPEPDDKTPKAYDASKLKSASKRQNRPFAPPERETKSKVPSKRGVLLNVPRAYQYTRSELVNLQYLITLIQQCQQRTIKGGTGLPGLFEQLRTHLQDVSLYGNVTDVLVRDSKLLENGGLPSIFDNINCDFPHDLCSDALALYTKWLNCDFDPDLFRGIEHKFRSGPDGGGRKSRNLQPDYHLKVPTNYVGGGSLTNGQWWPLQICLLRDGAHGAIEGGICGKPGGVAYSVIVTHSEYADVDKGNLIEYCGVRHLFESSDLRQVNGTYLPKKGIRYDGLYDVTGFEILHVDSAMHRFTLVRQQGQNPIRHTGVGARPNEKELAIYQRLRKDLGLPA
ncbi:protein CSN12 [Physcia stellaris]|nr:protein CSN12 [Physcia stellaris]